MNDRDKWFYLSDNEPKGPISGAELHALYENKTLDSNSLVARVGEETWQPLSNVLPSLWRHLKKSKLAILVAGLAAGLLGCAPLGLLVVWTSKYLTLPQKRIATALMVVIFAIGLISQPATPKIEGGQSSISQTEAAVIDNPSNQTDRATLSDRPRITTQPAPSPSSSDKIKGSEVFLRDEIRIILTEALGENEAANIEKIQATRILGTPEFNVTIHFNCKGSRVGDDIRMVKTLKTLFLTNLPIHEIWLFNMGTLTDVYGATSRDVVYKISMTKEVADKVHWDNILFKNFSRVWDVDWLEPSYPSGY